jgi:putative mRNA 3-end processing factor
MSDLLTINENGLYCAEGDFYIDPWRGVERAVITHAHSDHARWGSKKYLATERTSRFLRERVQPAANIQPHAWGEPLTINGVRVSFHPAGHIAGSAQVRVEAGGRVTVASGDYKVDADPTSEAFEPVKCDTFISECTFGLPIYRWPHQDEVKREINAWWRGNQEEGRTSILMGYALGKAQRLLACLDESIGPIGVHGAVLRFVEAYKELGIALPEVVYATAEEAPKLKGKGIIVAPPSAAGTTWLRKFGKVSLAFASGWMTVRGMRRQRAADRGFIISDHADWDGLMSAIEQTGAENIWLTHGATGPMAHWLGEKGYNVRELSTRYTGETDTEGEEESEGADQKERKNR